MTHDALVLLTNVSWQFGLAVVLAWVLLKVCRARSAFGRNVVWLCVLLSPLLFASLHGVAARVALVHTRANRH